MDADHAESLLRPQIEKYPDVRKNNSCVLCIGNDAALVLGDCKEVAKCLWNVWVIYKQWGVSRCAALAQSRPSCQRASA